MGQSVIRNPRKIHSQSGGDPSLPSRVTNLENNEYKITYYEIISGASGSITIPTGATINAGEFGLSGNCVLSKIDGSNKPTFESPKTAGGTIVTASLNVSTGAWVASGTYTDSSVALIYSIKIKAINYSNLTYANIIETVELTDFPISQSITNGITNKTPSEDAVFDALALKSNIASPTFTGTVTTPSLNVSGQTASTVPYLDANKNLVSSSVTPTTLGYLDATSSIQTQLDDKVTVWRHSFSAQINPADAQYYYFGIQNFAATNAANNATNYIRDLGVPKTGTIIAAIITQYCSNSSSATTETSTLVLRNSDTSTNNTITSTYSYNNAGGNLTKCTTVTGLNISVTQGQLMQSIIGNATWATNPTGVILTVDYLIE